MSTANELIQLAQLIASETGVPLADIIEVINEEIE